MPPFTGPIVRLSNRSLALEVWAPDAGAGLYRGTRFDWSGMIGRLEHAGVLFHTPWFDRVDPAIRDFTDDGTTIVAGAASAGVGPCEEFVAALGYEQARDTGTFVKIGVGVLERPPGERAYDRFNPYEIVDHGAWTVRASPREIVFGHVLQDETSGFAYAYEKSISLVMDAPEIVIAHQLRNTGGFSIDTTVYSHNFLTFDVAAHSRGVRISAPFALRAPDGCTVEHATMREGELEIPALVGQHVVSTGIEGFGTTAADHRFEAMNPLTGAGVAVSGDQPLAKVWVWAIRAVVSVEPFVAMAIAPGGVFAWEWRYTYAAPGGVRVA